MINCDKCGLCCKFCDKIEELHDYDRGNGICKHLNEKNECDIYSDRPVVCNSTKIYERDYKDLISQEKYKELCDHICRKMKLLALL